MSVLLVLPRIERRRIKTTQPDQLYRAAAHYWRTVHRLTDKQVQTALEHFRAGATLAEAAQAAQAREEA